MDIRALIEKADIGLLDMLAAARKLYGTQYNPMTTLQALGDLDNPALSGLSHAAKRSLRKAVTSVDPVSLLADLRKANIKPR